ncbi:MAG: hypothetical protein LAQ69_11855 [Acidobacteriia bacterium]|nr:hypothetical protein [Terriglobia bacterium]
MRGLLAAIPPLLVGVAAFAFNSASDTAGPLTVQMQPPAVGAYGAGGYADLARAGVPFAVPVSLQNAGEHEIAGTLRMAVIDGWKVAPAGLVPFRIRPRGRLRQEFTLSFPPETYNAHYPIHVYAEFEWGGQKLVAHPVMMVQPHIPDLPRPKLPTEWRPVPIPKGGTLGLWRMPVRRETVEIANAGAEAGVAGREVFDAGSVILYGALAGNGEAREGIGMTLGQRPPSKRETVEAAAVEYPLALPEVTPLRFEFAVAGGASFEVKAARFADGGFTTVFQRRPQGGGFEQVSVDLARYAGSSIRLRLEARDGTGEEQWADPTIVAGNAPKAPAFPPVGGDARLLGTADGCEVRLWPGSRGLLDAPVGFLCGDRRLFFRGLRVRVTGDALEDWRASSELLEAREEPASGRVRVRHRFRNWAGTFDLMSEMWVEREVLRARVWLENAPAPRPWFQLYLEAVSAGAWSETATRVYGGPGNVIEKPRAFRLGFDGHNLATSFVGLDFANGISLVQNSDAIPDRLEVDPERRIYSLVTPHTQTLEFFPARNVFAAVKRIREQDTRQPSKGVAKLAGRFTFDLWSGRYGDSVRDLEHAAGYGMKDALVVWHNWQRWGYDYRLPDIYPPNPQLGTMDEFRELAVACKRNGALFAPHDNYVDFYPDFEGFTYDSIVFRQNGTPYRAWFNYGREAQAYRARPDRLLPYVKRNVGLVKEGFAPSAYFIDVWSSMAPYDYWTNDGKFVDRRETQRVWGGVLAWIRDYLGDDAPQLSEAGHDKLIGWLDGADAQQLRIDPEGRNFTWKIQCSDSERIPWIDVAWHDKFILHGAGYEGRYQGGLDQGEHGAYSDDYITTEVLSGRPAMVPQAFNRDVVRVHWLLNDAMKALALDRIGAVEFVGNNIHRQHVKWERGGEVWVNRGADVWTVEGHTLPRYGFYLRAGETEAAIELRGGERVEWSRSPERRYEGGRLTMASGKGMELPGR